jgi:hypothetical protein
MIRWALLAYSLLTLMDCTYAYADIVLDGSAAGLAGRKVYVDEQFSGLVGDPLVLSPGQHTIGIEGDHNIRLSLKVEQDADKIKLVGSSSDITGCSSNTPIWRVQGWNVPPVPPARINGAYHVVLGKPTYTPTNMSVGCEPSSMGCSPRSMAADVRSTPQGAQIWVKEKLVATTNTAISLPFCDFETSRKILIRLNDYEPCDLSVTLHDHSTTTLTCILKKPGS